MSNLVNAVHYYTSLNEKRCFLENLSQDDLLFGDFDAMIEFNANEKIFENDPYIKLKISIEEIFDNYHNVMNAKISHDGEFTFTALDTGEHKICITPYLDGKPERQYTNDNKIRVFMDLDIGDVKVLDSKKTTDIQSLKARVNDLILRVKNVKAEQLVFREKEAIFRDHSESTNRKIMVWSIIQLLVLGAMCAFEMKYLKNFFVKQKVL